MFTGYAERLKKHIFENPDLASVSPEDKDGIFDHIYEYALFTMYQKIFPQTPSVEDQHFTGQLEKFQSLGPEYFDIKPENRHTEVWDLALKSESHPLLTSTIELKKVEKKQTPKTKLAILADVYKLVADSIEVFSKKKESAGAEDSMPVLVYLFSRAKFSKLISTLKYDELVK